MASWFKPGMMEALEKGKAGCRHGEIHIVCAVWNDDKLSRERFI